MNSEKLNSATDAQNMGGALVRYGPGATVNSLLLPSDFSAVRVTNLPADSSSKDIQELIATFGEAVPLAGIHLVNDERHASVVADIKMEDPRFSRRLAAKVQKSSATNKEMVLNLSVIQASSGSGMGAGQLQMSTVICTWYKPFRVAWLHYNTAAEASDAVRRLNDDHILGGRRLQASLQTRQQNPLHLKQPIAFVVQVGNLNPLTTVDNLKQRLGNSSKPTEVTMGNPSYIFSDVAAQKLVKDMLEEVDLLESWKISSTVNANRTKAMARFRLCEDAQTAIKKLNGTKVPQFAESRIFISLQISVKFNVLKSMYNAIQSDLDDLKRAWETEHVHVKTYPSTGHLQNLIAIRICGEDNKYVAKAKSAFENILAGDVATNGKTSIWIDFFASAQGLMYIKELGRKHNAFIYRDNRKSQLSLYGSVTSKKNVQTDLLNKVESLSKGFRRIVLSSDELRFALHGGFRRIVHALGRNKCNLNILEKSINIDGTDHERDMAYALVVGRSMVKAYEAGAFRRPNTAKCAVCLTEAEEPFQTKCGHVYCSGCFENQCSSISHGVIPIRCYGNSGHCLRVFDDKDLKDALPLSVYEKLLRLSLSRYIQANPKEFQYCCTPDCEQIYRTSADGLVITCSACLTAICTTCQAINHDGLSCAEHKLLSSAGNEEYTEWKKQNGVKECPRCKMEIEKEYGCNHVECRVCHAHICWVCMADFDKSKEIYAHMIETHGRIDGGD